MTESDNRRIYNCSDCNDYQPAKECYEHNYETRLCEYTPDGHETWFTMQVQAHLMQHKQRMGDLEVMVKGLE